MRPGTQKAGRWLGAALVVTAWAGCGGETIASTAGLDGGAAKADGAPASSSSSGGSTGGSSSGGGGSTGGGGSNSGSSGSSGSSGGTSSGGPTSDSGVVVVPGNPLPCGSGVCTPPDICCQRVKTGPATCEAASLCIDSIAHGCTDETCPSGALCCGTAVADAGVFGSTECQVTTQCSADTAQVCTPGANDCAAGDFCSLEADALGVDFCFPTDAGAEGGNL
jgi:hypothetical protein